MNTALKSKIFDPVLEQDWLPLYSKMPQLMVWSTASDPSTVNSQEAPHKKGAQNKKESRAKIGTSKAVGDRRRRELSRRMHVRRNDCDTSIRDLELSV